MAKNAAVWGLDIGRCALKALRCRMDGDAVVADGFDYIEYPKLLTQPDADAPQLVKEALEQFLSRNSVRGDKVAISVSGESGLARYFKPPPVDVKKIADIVKYEAKQQIPFALEDVIWDYQRMAGGQEVDGFALDTEIGLFAMKREQVQKALAPFNKAGIEVDVIQLAPIAIYNYVSFDVTKELGEGEEYNSEAPPPSIVVLSVGTDTSDLVVTNGYRVWQRNIPLGGNHFTKQLSKELKLTFAKAEHLKRNPKQADDPKAIFQSMRPVFADMVTEVQRSLGFFQSLDRKAKIEGIVVLGNTVKLPGLVQYLSKHLGYEVREIESFKRLSGTTVVASPSFKDNLLAFGVSYGLCLQALQRSKLSTNLLPREIETQRMIRAKKPWALAAVGAIVLACALNYVGHSAKLNEVHPDRAIRNVTWKSAVESAKSVQSKSSRFISEDDTKVKELEFLKSIGQEVVGASDRRLLWLEVMRAINAALPPIDPSLPPGVVPDPSKIPIDQRKDLKIEYVETQFFPDLSVWFNDTVKGKWAMLNPELAMAPPSAAGATPATLAPAPAPVPAPAASTDGGSDMPGYDGGMDAYGSSGGGYGAPAVAAPTIDVSSITATGPTGPGWVVEIKGHHFYNNPKDPRERRNIGPFHLQNTLLKNLEHGWVDLPLGPGLPLQRFKMKELGIGYAIEVNPSRPYSVNIPNPNYTPPITAPGSGSFGSAPGPMGFNSGTQTGIPGAKPAEVDPNNPEFYTVQRYDFVVQFTWVETPLNVRLENRRKAEEEAAKLAAEQAAAAPSDPAAGDPAASGAVAPAPAPPAGNPPVPSGNPVAPANGAVPPENPATPPVPGPMPPVNRTQTPAVVPPGPAPAVPDVADPGAGPVPPAAGPMPPDVAEQPMAPPVIAPAIPEVPM
jgi:type IV pilus assembly protein PilM